MNEHAALRPLVRLVALSGGRFDMAVTSKGVAILIFLFALEVAALWQLLPW